MAFIRFVSPSVCRWKAVLSLFSISTFPVVSFHRSEVNSIPLSVMISCASLYSLTISFMKRLANYRASGYFEHGIKGIFFSQPMNDHQSRVISF